METIISEDYNQLLKPIIDSLNKGSINGIYLKLDILNRINDIIEQVHPNNIKDAISLIDSSLNDVFDFMNFPNNRDIESYVNYYIEDIEAIQENEFYFIEEENDIFNIYEAAIKTILFEFISLLETN